jgi:5'-nucleotidase
LSPVGLDSGVTEVLLTNDDGIDAVGLQAVTDALESVADVTVVAPEANQSGCSRQYNRQFSVSETERGWAVAGTPTDCVHFGRDGLDTEFDVVVSGCNDGPNVGAHKLGQSGTVAAAVEAAFLGIPGVALSVFDPPTGVREFERADYEEAGRLARFLVGRLADSDLPDGLDYLNCNVPAEADDPPLRVTEPVHDFDVSLEPDEEGGYRLFDHFYDPLVPDNGVSVTDSETTDRGALAREVVSVSPLSVRHRVPDDGDVRRLFDGYGDRKR